MSRANNTKSGRWKISRQGYVPILLLVTLGVVITWALVRQVSRLESERVETAFTAAARDRILALQREFQYSLNVVHDIGSFFDANHQVGRGQYREFVQPVLHRDPSIRSLEWVPAVTVDERDEFLRKARISFPRFSIASRGDGDTDLPPGNTFFPLLYAHPYKQDQTPLGLDLASVPEEFPAIQRARDQRGLQIIHSRASLPHKSSEADLNVYLPVFENPRVFGDWFDDDEDRPEAVETSLGRLRGVAIGRFQIKEIVDRALSNLSPSGIDIAIRVAESGRSVETQGEPLYTHMSRLRRSLLIEPGNAVIAPPALADTIEVAGNHWSVVCTAVPGIFEPSVWSTRLVFAGGTAFTLLLAAYLLNLIGRAEEVERLVSRRTLELELTNQALNRQISERLKVEQTLQILNATLERRVALRTAEAERRAGELEQFAYVTSHDLKAPLRAIANLAEWLKEDLAEKLTDETREQLKLMRDRVGRMHGLVEGLLAYSRVGRTAGELEQVDTRALVAEVVDSLAPPPGFDVEIATYLPDLYTDRLQLSQVFSNLISNSIKHHHREAGRIRVFGRDLDSHCEFTVADDGPGIPKKYHNKVFMMFHTLQVKDFGSNTGIGLALVKKIVEEHEGNISLKSDTDAGTEICFTWAREKGRNLSDSSDLREEVSAAISGTEE